MGLRPVISHIGSARIRTEQQQSSNLNKAARDPAAGAQTVPPERNASGDPDTQRPVRRGALGVVDLVDCVRYGSELADEPLATGPCCWLLANRRPFEQPINCPGQLGLWHFDHPDDRRQRGLF